MATRRNLVAAARGDHPLDILIRDAQLVNVLTKTIERVDIGIVGDRIACVVPTRSHPYTAQMTIDADGRYVTPGFVDGHVHNESSMVTPAQWARTIVPKGTTTVCTDPHEIGNVLGLQGIRYMLDASEGLPLRYFVTAPSCVPAVPSVETAGATITDREMEELLSWDRVIAVAEAMDYPGLINQVGNITPIVEAGHRRGVPIEGHAPAVIGTNLQAYLAAAGPRASDHESLSGAEMLEKVRAGMMVYARGSSFLDTIGGIAEALRQVHDTRYFGFCTDDIFPNELLRTGHLDFGMRRLIQQGVDPVTVVQMATLNVAQHYGLHGIGAVAPGWLADLLILESLEDVRVKDVIVGGTLVVQDGAWVIDVQEPVPSLLTNTVRVPAVSEESFQIRTDVSNGRVTLNAIDMSGLLTTLRKVELATDAEGRVIFGDGTAIAAIVPRHGQGTAPNVAPTINYPIQGAIGSTISHDSHNLALIGSNSRDMLLAVRELERVGGGLVAVNDGRIVALVELPIAGLMSPLPVDEIAARVTAFEEAMPELGLPPIFPFGLVVMALPVYPEVRITDMGMVDVATQQFVPVLA